ncbi:receptor-like protein kinase, partial [Trifolium medium]|nr:receptor-like protein kinase [Trifolium medium]
MLTLSFDYPMFSHNCDLPLEFRGHATIEDYDYVFRLTGYPADPDKASYVGQ